jgi:hypothetical protein
MICPAFRQNSKASAAQPQSPRSPQPSKHVCSMSFARHSFTLTTVTTRTLWHSHDKIFCRRGPDYFRLSLKMPFSTLLTLGLCKTLKSIQHFEMLTLPGNLSITIVVVLDRLDNEIPTPSNSFPNSPSILQAIYRSWHRTNKSKPIVMLKFNRQACLL